ncbi:MAG TPA: NADH-quinone oxidoreductase subunit NuoN [Leucothrix mucor]|uniref:NADH-quinone oxidoreductase subunit N n=1 Tax=Leucothrix mucor TaxID=45248 RepID=A0A7V2T0Z9_LEUMU|nr:NADH-quinone oxidoreductase subunit NuoN [Leucothrix mucor]
MSGYLSEIAPAYPEIFLLVATCAVLLVDLFVDDENRIVTYIIAQLSLAMTAWMVYSGADSSTVITTFNDMFIADPMARVLKISVLLITMAVFAYSRPYLKDRNMFKGELFTLGLFAVLGMMVMISAQTLLLVYLGLELLSLSLYAMVAFRRDNGVASEAAMKYFVLGAIASGMLLYGMSIIYGLSGSLNLHTIATNLAMQDSLMSNIGLLLGLSFILIGLGFKLGVVPFHMWIPDVYHGAPTAITMFLGAAPKIAVFAMILRLLVEALGGMSDGWQQILILLAALSLFVGNVIAIAQTNLKRMLAYSTISHMGFVAMGVLAANEAGYAASMFYMITYAIISMGGFAVIIFLSSKQSEADELADLKGLGARHPWIAFMMLLFLFSMAGVPPTVGFYAKLSVIQAVVSVDLVWLAVFAVVMSVIGAYYYLRAIKIMYFDEAEKSLTPSQASFEFGALLSINGLAVLALGILPGGLMAICVSSIQAIF